MLEPSDTRTSIPPVLMSGSSAHPEKVTVDPFADTEST